MKSKEIWALQVLYIASYNTQKLSGICLAAKSLSDCISRSDDHSVSLSCCCYFSTLITTIIQAF